jgi:hypothetical protein
VNAEAEAVVSAWDLGRMMLAMLGFLSPFCFLSYMLGRAVERDRWKEKMRNEKGQTAEGHRAGQERL